MKHIHVARMGRVVNIFKILIGKPEVVHLEDLEFRWEDNIKVSLKKAG
jgi:hypothetical protein